MQQMDEYADKTNLPIGEDEDIFYHELLFFRAENEKLIALLKESEWSRDTCWSCGKNRDSEPFSTGRIHAPDCKLAAALKKAGTK